MRRRFFFFWIGIGLVVLFIFLYLPGLSRYHELKTEKDRLEKELAEIELEIKGLQEEKTLLQNDLDYLEKVIRQELGLVKPGEMVYKVVPERKPSGSAESPENSEARKVF